MTARYALYFTPRAGTPWARFGHAALSGDARRYGFHATLKAPFRLARGARLADLQEQLDTYCSRLGPFPLAPLRIQRIDDFIALANERPEPRIDAIAAHAVMAFDRFRAPPDDAELAKRRARGLSARQEDYLMRWGYPYVLEEFRFHLSLTGASFSGGLAVPPLPDAPLHFDAISLMEEPAPGAAFRLLERYPFAARGRLLYVVGPSGAGKDSVLAWVRENLPGRAPIVFARRTITRAPDPQGEAHRSVTREQFEAEHAAGAFAMSWEANGHRYGIDREIRTWLAQGLTVVVNGSRAHLPQALESFPALQVVHVTAPADTLRARLSARGREPTHEIAGRLERNRSLALPAAVECIEIVNDSALDVAGRRLLGRVLQP